MSEFPRPKLYDVKCLVIVFVKAGNTQLPFFLDKTFSLRWLFEVLTGNLNLSGILLKIQLRVVLGV